MIDWVHWRTRTNVILILELSVNKSIDLDLVHRERAGGTLTNEPHCSEVSTQLRLDTDDFHSVAVIVSNNYKHISQDNAT